ncbi:hypothetical protein IKG45_03120 [Candidatus Saccharibacteria bacterium]|nr:hypothetical protein [Candidatus Saccharibacteria bacterium]
MVKQNFSWAKKHLSGDSIIEVLIAVAIFSAIAVAALGIMNKGLENAQSSLETTIARTEMDAQAEKIRFLADSISSDPGDPSNENSNSGIWQKMTNDALDPDDGNYKDFIESYKKQAGLSSCSGVIKDGNSEEGTNYHAFVLGPNNSFITRQSSHSDSSAIPGVVTGGLFVVPVKSPNEDSKGRPEYYDFYINTCWNEPGSPVPTKLSTTIRIQNPAFVTEEHKDPGPAAPTPGKVQLVLHWNSPTVQRKNGSWVTNFQGTPRYTGSLGDTFRGLITQNITNYQLSETTTISDIGKNNGITINSNAFDGNKYEFLGFYNAKENGSKVEQLSYTCDLIENAYNCAWNNGTVTATTEYYNMTPDISTVHLYAHWEEKQTTPAKGLNCVWFRTGKKPEGYGSSTIKLSPTAPIPFGTKQDNYDETTKEYNKAGYKVYDTTNQKFIYCVEDYSNYRDKLVGGVDCSQTDTCSGHTVTIHIPDIKAEISSQDFSQFGWHANTYQSCDPDQGCYDYRPQWTGNISHPCKASDGANADCNSVSDAYYYNPSLVTRTEGVSYGDRTFSAMTEWIKDKNNDMGISDFGEYLSVRYINFYPQWRANIDIDGDSDDSCRNNNDSSCALHIVIKYDKHDSHTVTFKPKVVFLSHVRRNDTVLVKNQCTKKVFGFCTKDMFSNGDYGYIKIEAKDDTGEAEGITYDGDHRIYKTDSWKVSDYDLTYELNIDPTNSADTLYLDVLSLNNQSEYKINYNNTTSETINYRLKSGATKSMSLNPGNANDRVCWNILALKPSTGALYIKNTLSNKDSSNTCAAGNWVDTSIPF